MISWMRTSIQIQARVLNLRKTKLLHKQYLINGGKSSRCSALDRDHESYDISFRERWNLLLLCFQSLLPKVVAIGSGETRVIDLNASPIFTLMEFASLEDVTIAGKIESFFIFKKEISVVSEQRFLSESTAVPEAEIFQSEHWVTVDGSAEALVKILSAQRYFCLFLGLTKFLERSWRHSTCFWSLLNIRQIRQ